MANFSIFRKRSERQAGPPIEPSDAFFLTLGGAPGDRDRWSVWVGEDQMTLQRQGDRPVAPIPGWVWAGLDEDAAEVTFRPAGRRKHRVSLLTRGMVLDRLAAMAQARAEDVPDYALIAALEHLHHGAFWADLAPETHGWFCHAARAVGLADILPLFDSAPLPHPEPAPLSRIILRRFGRAVRAAGASTSAPMLRDILEEYHLPDDTRQDLCRDLIPHFCGLDQVEDLFDALLPQGGAGAYVPDPDPDNGWRHSLDLPALYLREDFDAVQAIMNQLAAAPQVWVSTPAVAWLMRRVVTVPVPFLPFHLFEGILRAALTLIDTRSDSGRGGQHCAALRQAAVTLLARRWMASDQLQTQMDQVCARAFGASPAFWNAVAAAGITDLPPALTRARATLDSIAAGSGQIAEADAPHGALRMALETGQLPPDTSDLLLRQCAAPFAPPPNSATQLADAARRAYPGLPLSPVADLQAHVMQDALQMLQAARNRPDTPDHDLLDRLMAGLTRLAGLASGGVGLALTCALIEDLDTAPAWADGLAQRMQPIFARVSRNAGADLAQAPAMITAAARLATLDTPAARTLRDTLPDPLQQATALHPAAGPALFDTLVVVYSCRAHLDTRIPALRDTWLRDLQTIGVPYVILTGGAETRLDGDILTVAAGDDYESLPAKTLAMVDWVRAETGYGHLLKVDDDCYLDARAFFFDPTYRRHPYYGRRLDKSGALSNRTWHQPRSTTRAARLSFEKLPRSALYADGGTGYLLNRAAMTALCDRAATPEGRALCHAAYSEDKLVGALLAGAGIEPAEMSYHTAVERAAAPDVPAVPQWVSGLRPGALGVTKLMHLDAGGDMRAVQDARADLRPHPPRIWASHRAPRLGYNSGALHLLSSETRLQQVAGAEIAAVSVVRNEARMLPHFLAHYRARGVGGFLIADNGSEDGTLAYLMAQPDVALFSADTEFRVADQGTDWKIALMSHYRRDAWSIVADADELLLYPGYPARPLGDWLARMGQADAVCVRMLDMYPEGPLAQAHLDTDDLFALAPFTDRQPFLADSLSTGPYENSPTWTSAVRHRLTPQARPELFVAQKMAVLRYRPWMQLSTSLHYATDVQVAPDMALFAHFKYHADFAAKAQREIRRGQYYNNAEEYRRYVTLAAEGRDRIFDPAVSCHWQDCDPVRELGLFSA